MKEEGEEEIERVCITGGNGFLGRSLAAELEKRNLCRPTLLDVSDQPIETNRWEYKKVDVRDVEGLSLAFAGCGAVFHVASFGMSGADQLEKDMVHSINVQGTKAVIEACKRCKVRVLVFTSTYNVVFGGQVIDGEDESMPYFPLDKHADEYSKSKAIAEMLVLGASSTNDGIEENLYTCALRPAAIWGKGERRHMRRVHQYIKQGKFCIRFGDPRAKMDFVHIDNLVQAHILAYQNLKTQKTAAGQAYFISDGEQERINNFDFFSQLAIGLGYQPPRFHLPLLLVYIFAFLFEILYRCTGISPLLTRAEVLKSGVHHWCSIARAQRELGYSPSKHSFSEVVEEFKPTTSSTSQE